MTVQDGVDTCACFSVCLALAVAVDAFVQAQRPNRPKLPGEDWVQLFNGTDLTGWIPVGNENWVVENGVIQGKTLTDGYGYLKTDKLYKDFHLSVKFLCVGSGNSGVFFHSDFKPGTADVSQGLQFEVDCNIGQHTGGLYGDGRQWIVWPAPENETVVRKNEWNEYLLKVEGNRYISRLNGVPMVDFTDPQPKSFDGAISLQLHSGGAGHMQFKDIWVQGPVEAIGAHSTFTTAKARRREGTMIHEALCAVSVFLCLRGWRTWPAASRGNIGLRRHLHRRQEQGHLRVPVRPGDWRADAGRTGRRDAAVRAGWSCIRQGSTSTRPTRSTTSTPTRAAASARSRSTRRPAR